jgi:hypothetical protein
MIDLICPKCGVSISGGKSNSSYNHSCEDFQMSVQYRDTLKTVNMFYRSDNSRVMLTYIEFYSQDTSLVIEITVGNARSTTSLNVAKQEITSLYAILLDPDNFIRMVAFF